MWIFTQDGFLSVVPHRDDTKRLPVRARIREDLGRFCRNFKERAYHITRTIPRNSASKGLIPIMAFGGCRDGATYGARRATEVAPIGTALHPPDPEVMEKKPRRNFTAAYKRRILARSAPCSVAKAFIGRT